MAAVSTKCRCGCESIINSDIPKQFINNRVCFKCKEPLKFRVKDEAQDSALPETSITNNVEVKEDKGSRVTKQQKTIKSKVKKGAKR